MVCSLLGSSVHGILQTRILERVAIPFSRGQNGDLLHCRQILYCLNHQRSPKSTTNECHALFSICYQKYSAPLMSIKIAIHLSYNLAISFPGIYPTDVITNK